ncbi:hypothetical protein, partial [Mesorhizobium sp.]|uniref:hypothetical protein n=1 Tax=Mesorhizobium sp. TaxID=1871066 RepID=UPI0025B8479C
RQGEALPPEAALLSRRCVQIPVDNARTLGDGGITDGAAPGPARGDFYVQSLNLILERISFFRINLRRFPMVLGYVWPYAYSFSREGICFKLESLSPFHRQRVALNFVEVVRDLLCVDRDIHLAGDVHHVFAPSLHDLLVKDRMYWMDLSAR